MVALVVAFVLPLVGAPLRHGVGGAARGNGMEMRIGLEQFSRATAIGAPSAPASDTAVSSVSMETLESAECVSTPKVAYSS